MSLRIKLTFLIAVTTTVMFGSTVNFVGPSQPKPGSTIVIGNPLAYEVFGAQLTQPTGSNPNWVLQIETNYGANISGNTIPPYLYGDGTGPFSIGDFLIVWNGGDYGIVLSPHVAGVAVDSYTAGNLYQASGFVTSGDIMNTAGSFSPNPGFNIWLSPGGTNRSPTTGSVSVAKTGTGIDPGVGGVIQAGDGLPAEAMYTITVMFSAPPGFLGTGNFSIDFSSYVCGNGDLTGGGNFPPPIATPEPGTLLLVTPALLLFGFRLARKRGPQAG